MIIFIKTALQFKFKKTVRGVEVGLRRNLYFLLKEPFRLPFLKTTQQNKLF